MLECTGHPVFLTVCSGLAIVMLAGSIACGDDGSANSTTSTTGSSSGSIATTTSDGTGVSTVDATTGIEDSTGGSSTEGTSSSGSDDGSSSSSEGSTGTAAFDVPFTVLDPYGIPLTTRVQPGWTVITSAAEWDALTGAPVPMGVSFPRQWLVFGSHGPQAFPGHELEVSVLTWEAGTLRVDGNAIEPDADCETFQFTWPTDTLLAIDALAVEVSAVDDQSVLMGSSCAMGAGQAVRCDLDTPCATGLLCAALIRTTVLSNRPWGICGPVSHGGVFSGGAIAIPNDGSTAQTSLVASGLATVDTDVALWIELDHPAPEELVIELRNPSFNQVPVASLQTSPLHPGGVGIVPTGFSGDETVNGTWWLVVSDSIVNGNNGGVVSWELEIMSRFD